MKDEADQALDALFRSEPIADEGFSGIVTQRIRRRLWVRRLTLPIALVVGAAIGAEPLFRFLWSFPDLLAPGFKSLRIWDQLPFGGLIDAPTLFLGTVLVLSVAIVGRAIED